MYTLSYNLLYSITLHKTLPYSARRDSLGTKNELSQSPQRAMVEACSCTPHTFNSTLYTLHCTVGRCDKRGQSLTYSATIYFPCVMPTKRSVFSEMLLHVIYTPNAPYFIRWPFSTHFSTNFCKILKESNVGLFQASKISHVLPQIKFWLFQTNSFLV